MADTDNEEFLQWCRFVVSDQNEIQDADNGFVSKVNELKVWNMIKMLINERMPEDINE